MRDGERSVSRLVISLRGAQQRARMERSRAELVSTVAHELRSPLTSVKGFTATLLSKWHRFTDDQKRVMLETVNADADRVTRLITELLDVSRIESGRMEVHRQLVDVPDRARRVIAGRVAAGEAEDRFRIADIPVGLPETWLDADKIDQILGNLVENAVRHGSGIVTIVVESAQIGGDQAIAVSVRDQGEGIPPEMAARVFRQFWRGKRRGGTGLGLYIVKGLVEALGGTITVGRRARRRRGVPIYPARRGAHRIAAGPAPAGCFGCDGHFARTAHPVGSGVSGAATTASLRVIPGEFPVRTLAGPARVRWQTPPLEAGHKDHVRTK